MAPAAKIFAAPEPADPEAVGGRLPLSASADARMVFCVGGRKFVISLECYLLLESDYFT